MKIKPKTWTERFNELIQFKEIYGHCDVSNTPKHKEYATLSHWVSKMRAYYKRKNKLLTQERINMLNNIGFKWSTIENLGKHKINPVTNEEALDELKRVSLILGKPPRLRDIEQYGKFPIYIYVYRFGGLRNALYKVGSGSSNDFKWNKMFWELKKFKSRNGHCRVVLSIKNKKQADLAFWANKQRRGYKDRSKWLTHERIAKLNSLGFEWLPPDNKYTKSKNDSIKENLLKNLKKIHSLIGRPPSIKELDKYGKFTGGMYQNKFGGIRNALSEAGFDVPDNLNLNWDKRFYELKKNMEKNEHRKVFLKNMIGDDKPLLYWVYDQRRNNNTKSPALTPERIAKLNSIGFNWGKPHSKRRSGKKKL